MAPPPKRRGGGRVTPKGTQPTSSNRSPGRSGGGAANPFDDGPHRAGEASSRYTPPMGHEKGPSPAWVPALMFALLAIGGLVIICNYLGVLPGGTENWYLVVGLAFILGGIGTATQYR